MKIRKAIKMAVAGAAFAVPVGTAMAMGGTPMTIHGNWDMQGGNINASCPSGYTCATVDNSDTGFMQRVITDNVSGDQYIQTIIGEGADNASFSNSAAGVFFGDESFVKMNGNGGISGINQITDDSGAGVFTSKAALNTGSEFMQMEMIGAAGVLDNGSMIELQQGIVDTANEFASTFEFDHGMIMNSGMAKFAVIRLNDYANDTAAGFTGTFQLESTAFEGGSAGFATTAAANESKKIDIVSNLNTTDITQDFSVKQRSGAGAVGNGNSTFLDTTQNTAFSEGDSIYQMDLAQTVTGVADFGMSNFQNQTTTQSGKQTSLTSGAIPFNTVTDDSTGGDPFAPF